MDPKQVVKQMIKFNKNAFDTTFDTMSTLQDQTEKMMTTYLNQTPLFPEEGKKAINDWLSAYKKGRADFRAVVDDNYKKVEGFFSGYEKAK